MLEQGNIQTYKNALEQYSKVELDQLRRIHSVRNASQLNKSKLAERLAEELPEKFKGNLIYFNKTVIELLNDFQQNNGVMQNKYLTEEIMYLEKQGYVFRQKSDNKEFDFIPEELLHVYAEFQSSKLKRTALRNTKWHKLTEGMLYYYGVLYQENIIAQIERLTNEKVDLFEFIQVMKTVDTMYGTFNIQTGESVLYTDYRVEEPEHILMEQSKRKQIPYYPFTEKQFLQASEGDYIQSTAGIRKLRKYLNQNFAIEKLDLLDILDEFIIISNINQKPTAPIEYFADILEFDTEQQFNTFVQIVMNAANDVRLWILKGHTPSEIAEMEKPYMNKLPESDDASQRHVKPMKKVKVGRNDPCPCGSGKKYKKCCM